MQEIYADPHSDNPFTSDPFSAAVPRAAVRRGTGAKSDRRESKQMRELPLLVVL